MKKYLSILYFTFLPSLLFAGGIKGPVFSEEQIIAFFSILLIIYSIALVFAILKNNDGKLWKGVISFILTSILLIPDLVLSDFIPQITLPILVLLGINYVLIFKKSKDLKNNLKSVNE